MGIFDLFNQIEEKKSTGPVSFIIAGLGNPGAEYERSRHNAGFMAIDYIAERVGCRPDRLKFKALTAECQLGCNRVMLMKPQTFMNNSGLSIGEAAAFYKIPPERVLVIFDEISFEPGIIRIRRKGSAGGHNGLKSIIENLHGDGFPRIKLGVGNKPRPDYDLADWVLGKFTDEGYKALSGRFEDAYQAALLIADGQIDDAMARFSK